ncbi:PL29 family lyase N-terminal domain-containing protein [Butyricimonas sp.]|uniref:PL29 family lyase N-terminal domain-containing protein n=1 Tax=Butyricimonas sp. TaxID=1969738 RepID=UPI0025C05CCE|nr:PL29 family lyase N-terminal domain-containing protein [Butyricimonas sp.]
MKKYLLILFTVGLFTGCSKYDDGELWNSVNDLEARLSALEKQCKEMNTNIESMKVIVDVLQSNDYITNVTVVSENGVEIGYKIDFHVHPSITIYHGKEGNAGETPYVGENGNWWVGSSDTGVNAKGENGLTPIIGSNGNWWIGDRDTGVKAKGENGKDGVTPVIGVKQAEDDCYYWTQKIGEEESTWILDSEGNKIKATGEDGQAGETPQLKIENDNWMLSVDNGVTWQNLGKAKGDKGDSFFESVTNDVNELTLVLEDGTVITLPKTQKFSVVLDNELFTGVLAGASYEINYTITSESEQINIETIAPSDWQVVVQKVNECSGKIVVTTANGIVTDEKVLVLVSDGKDKTTMRTIRFLKGNVVIEQTEYLVKANGGILEIGVLTDIGYNVSIATEDQTWVNCLNKTPNAFTLKVDANFGESIRYATIKLIDSEYSIVGEIHITQEIGEVYEGDLIIDESTNFYTLKNISKITGSLIVKSATSFNGLNKLQYIGGDFRLEPSPNDYFYTFKDLVSFEGLNNLRHIGGNFEIRSTTPQGGGIMYPQFASLVSFEGLNNLARIDGDFIIVDSYGDFPNLETFEGLDKLTFIGGKFYIERLNIKYFVGLESLQKIGGDMHFYLLPDVVSLNGLNNLQEIGGDMELEYMNVSLSYLEKLQKVGGSIYLCNLGNISSFRGLENLQEVGGVIQIFGCPYLTAYPPLNPSLWDKVQHL